MDDDGEIMEYAVLLTKVMALKGMLASHATGGGGNEPEYAKLRSELIAVTELRPKLPECVRTCRTLDDFWGLIKPKFAHYSERRDYLRIEFEPVLSFLETQVIAEGATRSAPSAQRALTKEQIAQRGILTAFLDSASEDEFTEKVLVPFFQELGFQRVSSAGHKEKTVEFGKDLWMKFQLPTRHWIYFCAQIKRVKIDSKGVSGGNVTEVLNQARMALEHPVFDPDLNRNVLLDHMFIISAAEITRQAKTWLIQHLDNAQRRMIIFMDRDEFLDHAASILPLLPSASPSS